MGGGVKGKVGMQGRITIKVIRAKPTLKTRIQDLIRKITFRSF